MTTDDNSAQRDRQGLRTLRLLGALARRFRRAWRVPGNHAAKSSRRACPTIIVCAIRSRSRKPIRSVVDLRRPRPRRLDRAAARRRDRAGANLGSVRQPARSSPMCRSIRRMRAAAADALREIRSLLAAAGVPSHAITVRHYHPDDPRLLRGDQAELSEDRGGRRSLRRVAGRSRPLDQQPRLRRKQAVLQFRLRQPAQPRRDDRQSRPTSCSRVPKHRPTPRGAPKPSRNTARAPTTRPFTPKPTRPN